MILPLLTGLFLYANLSEIDPQLSKLGDASLFVDPVPLAKSERIQNNRRYLISDDGKRIVLAESGERKYFHTWKTGEREALTGVYQGAYYNATKDRAFASWLLFRNGRLHDTTNPENSAQAIRTQAKQKVASFGWFVRVIGPMDNRRMAFWVSEKGTYGISASFLFWIDVTKRGPDAAGISFFRKGHYEFEDIDFQKKILLVRTPTKYIGNNGKSIPGQKQAFTLVDDYRRTRQIPVSKRYANANAFRTRSANFRWELQEKTSEIDYKTGTSVDIPTPPYGKRSFHYVGQDLFIFGWDKENEEKDISNEWSLYLWHRGEKVTEKIGNWEIVGQSANGKYMIVRKRGQSPEDRSQFLIHRKAGDKNLRNSPTPDSVPKNS